MNQIKTKLDLISYINQGNKVKYLFFWGHQPNKDGSIDKSCFSQWYQASFQIDGVKYQTASLFLPSYNVRQFDI